MPPPPCPHQRRPRIMLACRRLQSMQINAINANQCKSMERKKRVVAGWFGRTTRQQHDFLCKVLVQANVNQCKSMHMQPATCSLHPAPCSLQHAACSLQPAACSLHPVLHLRGSYLVSCASAALPPPATPPNHAGLPATAINAHQCKYECKSMQINGKKKRVVDGWFVRITRQQHDFLCKFLVQTNGKQCKSMHMIPETVLCT